MIVLHLSKESWNPVIIDFGKSEKIGQAKLGRKRDCKLFYWIAPEVLSGEVCPSPSSDIFSLGQMIRFVSKKVCLQHLTGMKDLYLSCLHHTPAVGPKSAQAVAVQLETIKLH